MAKRYTTGEQIQDLLKALNEKRKIENKIGVRRGWTSAAHWLMTDEKDYKPIGRLFIHDYEFIGFLEGLLFDLNEFDNWQTIKSTTLIPQQ
jgi:hypothetical protein